MNNVTQKSIADALGLSRETVTKGLANDPNISLRTRERILAKADEMGYVPNFFARKLVTEKSRIIGLILPKIAHSFFSAIAERVYEECRKRDYTVISMISFEDGENEANNIRTLLSMRIDGVIACITRHATDENIYRRIIRRGIPLVFFDRVLENLPAPCVVTDDRQMAFQSVSYALSHGYRRPAHLAGLLDVNIGKERRQGFIDALTHHDLDVDQSLIVECDTTREAGRDRARELLARPDRPDFIFAMNDNIAQGAYDAAREAGLSIPSDLGVIGFGDLDLGQMLVPPLTSVHIPAGLMAAKAVELIFDPTRKPGKVIIPAELVTRESC